MAADASPLRALIEANRTKIEEIVREHRGVSIAIFGSVARGEATELSDIDFLVDFEPSSSLLDLIHLEEALEELLEAARVGDVGCELVFRGV